MAAHGVGTQGSCLHSYQCLIFCSQRRTHAFPSHPWTYYQWNHESSAAQARKMESKGTQEKVSQSKVDALEEVFAFMEMTYHMYWKDDTGYVSTYKCPSREELRNAVTQLDERLKE